jgi:hypothetical protein
MERKGRGTHQKMKQRIRKKYSIYTRRRRNRKKQKIVKQNVVKNCRTVVNKKRSLYDRFRTI